MQGFGGVVFVQFGEVKVGVEVFVDVVDDGYFYVFWQILEVVVDGVYQWIVEGIVFGGVVECDFGDCVMYLDVEEVVGLVYVVFGYVVVGV